jgi:triosephosphate isomerase
MDKIVIGNLKTSLLSTYIVDYIKGMSKLKYEDVIICPSSIYIPYFLNRNFKVGIQDISMYDQGAHTGDILASQASSMGIKYAIIGHSERQNRESLEDINKKILAANKYGITSILCVGEEQQSKKTEKMIKQYLKETLKNTLLSKVIIAYEPVWAIGTNEIPSNKYIENMANFIKETIKKEFDFDIKVIYGGSVNKDNINSIKLIDAIDGILVGNASTIPNEFNEVISKYIN